MKPLITGLCAWTLIAFSAQMEARTGADEARPGQPYYSVANEFTLKATVLNVITKPTAGMMMGPHLLLQTAAGEVDASLGRWGLQGKGAMSVAAGDEIEVTGVMKTLMDKQVFLVRTAKLAGRVYVMRNEHGIAVSPQARERANAKIAHAGWEQ